MKGSVRWFRIDPQTSRDWGSGFRVRIWGSGFEFGVSGLGLGLTCLGLGV